MQTSEIQGSPPDCKETFTVELARRSAMGSIVWMAKLTDSRGNKRSVEDQVVLFETTNGYPTPEFGGVLIGALVRQTIHNNITPQPSSGQFRCDALGDLIKKATREAQDQEEAIIEKVLASRIDSELMAKARGTPEEREVLAIHLEAEGYTIEWRDGYKKLKHKNEILADLTPQWSVKR